jgi:hypothetical protein
LRGEGRRPDGTVEAYESPTGSTADEGGAEFVGKAERFEDLPPAIAGTKVSAGRGEKALGMYGCVCQLRPFVEVVEQKFVLDKSRRR